MTVLSAQTDADFAILDRYQSFSGEFIRLGLAGIAAVGAFVAWGSDASNQIRFALASDGAKIFIGLSFSLFATSVGSALGHRYWSTDAMASIVKMRRTEVAATGATETSESNRVAAEEESLRNRALRFSAVTLGVSAVSLLCAAVTFGIAVILTVP